MVKQWPERDELGPRPATRVAVAAESLLLRGALAALLAQEDDIDVVAELDCDGQVIPAVLEFRPDVSLIDIDSEDTDLLATASELRRQVPDARTLLLTGTQRPERLRRALAIAGDGGVVGKDAPADDLIEAIRKVAQGRHFVDSEMALAALREPVAPLSERERGILRLTADGRSVDDIAAALFLSPGTVRNHLTHINRMLGARNRIDAIRIASESGWL